MKTDWTTRPTASGGGRRRVNVGAAERVASAFGGAVLTVYGLRRASAGGLGLAAAGGALLFRGVTGFCPVNAAVGRDSSRAAGRPLVIRTCLQVSRPCEEVYRFWHRLENLPRFMHHLAEVRQVSGRRSIWVAPIPGTGGAVAWEAKLEAEEEGHRLAWRSAPGAAVENAGDVRFEAVPGGRGTEVHVYLSYRPPAGYPGHAAVRLLDRAFERRVREDLQRFKQVIETPSRF